MKTLTLTLIALTLLATATFALNEITLVGTYYGETTHNYFGSTAMGDFDDDGYDEFIIGAYGWNDYTGKNYYYDWDGDWPSQPAWTFQGSQNDVAFDVTDQNLGDINGDGIDDFGLSEFWAIKRLDFFFGSQPFDSVIDFTINSDFQVETMFGSFLDSLGDVNGDWGNDFTFSNMLPIAGHQARIYFGGEVLDTIPDWVISSYNQLIPQGLGDVNGDGFNDLSVLYGVSGSPKIFFGGSPMDTIPDLTFQTITYSTSFAIGDVNGDGYSDFSITFTPSLGRGVYFGGAEVDTVPDVYLLDEYGQPQGSSLRISHGDFNGDNISDIILKDYVASGRVGAYFYLGSPWFNGVPDAIIDFGDNLSGWGNEMSLGDVNGDGRDEALVSAPDIRFYQGRAYLYAGPETWVDYDAGVEPGDLQRHPGWFVLHQNYPNPFNAATTIHFELGKPSTVNILIYDLKGNRIKTLITDKQMLPGGYNVSWAGRNQHNQSVSSGIYVLELQVDQYRQIRKMVLLR